MSHVSNIYRLGIKELWSLARDPILLGLIVYTFSFSIYISATAKPETLHSAPIAIVDEDVSPLSASVVAAFYPPRFMLPQMTSLPMIDRGMDAGDFTFVMDIPLNFQRDVLAGKSPAIQLNVDATRMSQAFVGSSYIQQMTMDEVNEFVQRRRSTVPAPVSLALRARFNPNLEQAWYGSLMEIISNVTMLSIILTGAALIREGEHGTIEHLLVMPVTPAEIMMAKVWSMGSVVLVAAGLSLVFVVQGLLRVPHRRVFESVSCRDSITPVCNHVAGDFYGNAGELNAPVRDPRDSGDDAAAVVVGQRDSSRKHARLYPEFDAVGSDNALRFDGPGNPVSRRRA